MRRSTPPTAHTASARSPPVRPMTGAPARRPLPRDRSTVRRDRSVGTRHHDARCRSRRTASPDAAEPMLGHQSARRRHDRRQQPMPPVSNAHSASVTARPPSEQSCAERSSPAAARVHEQADQRSLARRDRAAADDPRPDRGSPSDTRCRRARRVVLAEQHDRRRPAPGTPAPRRCDASSSTPDDADDRRRIDRLPSVSL